MMSTLSSVDVFGSQHAEIASVLDRAKRLTEDEAAALETAYAADPPGPYVLWGVWQRCERDDGRVAAYEAVRLEALKCLAPLVVFAVVTALVARDLCSGASAAYRASVRAWSTVIGKAHPDDYCG